MNVNEVNGHVQEAVGCDDHHRMNGLEVVRDSMVVLGVHMVLVGWMMADVVVHASMDEMMAHDVMKTLEEVEEVVIDSLLMVQKDGLEAQVLAAWAMIDKTYAVLQIDTIVEAHQTHLSLTLDQKCAYLPEVPRRASRRCVRDPALWRDGGLD
jgi:hypothetical protein